MFTKRKVFLFGGQLHIVCILGPYLTCGTWHNRVTQNCTQGFVGPCTVVRRYLQRATIVPNRESIPEKNGVTEAVEEWRRGGSRPALLEEHFSSSPPPPTPLPTPPPALHLAHLLLHLRRPASLPMPCYRLASSFARKSAGSLWARHHCCSRPSVILENPVF